MTTNKIIKGYGVVVLKDDFVLLVKHLEKAGHLTGVYGLPAGRSQNDETEIETARRELTEETGLVVETDDLVEMPNTYVADIERSDGTVKKMSLKCYLAKKTSGEISTSVDDETDPEWVDVDKLNAIDLLPNVQNLINDALQLCKKEN